MKKTVACLAGALAPLTLVIAMSAPLEAVTVPAPKAIDQKVVRHPNLHIQNLERSLTDLGTATGLTGLEMELLRLGVRPEQGLYDWRGGRWSSLVLSRPLVAGDGKGNNLSGARPPSEAEVWQALSAFLRENQPQVRVEISELAPARIGLFEKGDLIQVHAPRVVNGVPVRDSGLTAIISHGNLVLLGLQNWGTLNATPKPAFSAAQAEAVVVAHVQPFAVDGFRADAHLELVPLARGQAFESVTVGDGYDYRLAWVLSPLIKDDLGSWEAVVDAATGELIAFEDKNAYAVRRVLGGAYPVSNDQLPPDGVEQHPTPMPFANIIGAPTSVTTTGGIVTACEPGPISTTLAGPFVRISDVCGAVNESSAAGDLDLAMGPTAAATDCVVPPGHSPGDTKASRTGFYELNRIKEQARAYLPTNTWLQGQLTSNMNINLTCNAFWSQGSQTVNFYRDNNSSCRNTGEIAAVFDHEWGHGMDDNGVNGSLSQPQEAYADIHGIYRLNNSCMGRGFFKNGVCPLPGDPCIPLAQGGCTGVRDLDFAKHVSGQPHGLSFVLANCPVGGAGPCNRQVHCEGQAGGETGWDLQFRDLRAAPFNYDTNTALELATRLWFLSSQTLPAWYSCNTTCISAGTCGCGATNWYMLALATDDDNGDINDGTPHTTAIRAAFERHQIHCSTTPPVVVNSGCAGGPTTAPVVVATPTAGGVDLTWAAVPGASNYSVYRTEGTNGCDFGKIWAGQTNGTSWTDTAGLLDGRSYLYSVLPFGANSSCPGRMSACATVTPTLAPDPCAVTNASVSFTITATTVAEAGINATVAVRVTTNNGQATTAPLTVDFATFDATATAPADYTSTSGTLSFPAGTASGASQNIVVPIIQETLDEDNEDFLVVLSNVAGGVISPNVSHVVTIVDDDVPVELQSFQIE